MKRDQMKRALLIFPLFLASCISSKPPTVQLNVTQISVTQISQIIITQIAQTAVTQIVATPQPSQTPWIITATPGASAPASEVQVPGVTPKAASTDTLYAVHGPGFYLVGIDIGSGHWRSNGVSKDGCMWRLTDKNNEFIDGNYGMAGVTITLTDEVFQAELGPGCGDWEYIPAN